MPRNPFTILPWIRNEVGFLVGNCGRLTIALCPNAQTTVQKHSNMSHLQKALLLEAEHQSG